MTANLVLQFPQEQKNIRQRYPSIACYYEGNEFTVSNDFQEVLSARYYWHNVPNKRLADMAHRLTAEGTLFKIYPKEITRLSAPDFDS